MTPTENWHWIERGSWIAGIAALVLGLWQLSRGADEKTAATVDALNKRLDAFHETLGERKKAYEELETKLVKLDKDHQSLVKQFEIESARQKAQEIASRPNVSEAAKLSSSALAAELAKIRFGNNGKPMSFSERMTLIDKASTGGFNWAPPGDRDILTNSLSKAKEPFTQFKLPTYPDFDKSMFTIPKPAEKTMWESFVEFIKKVPLSLGILLLIGLGNLFKK